MLRLPLRGKDRLNQVENWCKLTFFDARRGEGSIPPRAEDSALLKLLSSQGGF
jgi:hypothetical protein